MFHVKHRLFLYDKATTIYCGHGKNTHIYNSLFYVCHINNPKTKLTFHEARAGPGKLVFVVRIVFRSFSTKKGLVFTSPLH